MSSITLGSNISSLRAQRRLGQATVELSKTFERLTSGLRINKAADDAAGLAVSSSLHVDFRVATQAVKNVNDGISYLNVAEGATHELSGILVRLRELATQSSTGTYSNVQRRSLDTEAQALLSEYNRIVESAEYNGRQIFHNAFSNSPSS